MTHDLLADLAAIADALQNRVPIYRDIVDLRDGQLVVVATIPRGSFTASDDSPRLETDPVTNSGWHERSPETPRRHHD